MSTYAVKLPASAFLSGPEIRVVPVASHPIEIEVAIPPVQIEIVAAMPPVQIVIVADTPPSQTHSVSMGGTMAVMAIPRDKVISGWKLKSVLVVEISRGRREWVASTWLEGISEYGTGDDEGHAIADLVSSLGEYLQALQRREPALNGSGADELRALQGLIEEDSGLSQAPGGTTLQGSC